MCGCCIAAFLGCAERCVVLLSLMNAQVCVIVPCSGSSIFMGDSTEGVAAPAALHLVTVHACCLINSRQCLPGVLPSIV